MTDQERMAGHVFISYVREDSSRVDRLERLLQAAGLRTWRDTADLWPGEDWRLMIRNAITHDALVFLICFSRDGLARTKSYQNEELALAIEQMRLRRQGEPWLIPVRFDGCNIPDIEISAGRTLGSIQRADLFADRFEENAARLIKAVERILSPADLAANVSPALGAPPGASTGESAGSVPRPDDAELGLVSGKSNFEEAGTDGQEMPAAAGQSTAAVEQADQISRPATQDDDIWAEAILAARSLDDEGAQALAFARIASALASSDPAAAGQFATDAEHAAHAVVGDFKAHAIAAAAEAVAISDPGRAEQLFADALQAAQAITLKDLAVTSDWVVAKALTRLSPDRAERLAQAITDPEAKSKALEQVAAAVAVSDCAEAERIGRSIPDCNRQEWALAGIAERLATSDPDKAERIARSLTIEVRQAWLLAVIAQKQSSINPGRADRLIADAERVARSVPDEQYRPVAFTEAANALASANPSRAKLLITQAEQAARAITNERAKARADAEIARALALVDPGRSELDARSTSPDATKLLAGTDPDRAERMTRSITDDEQRFQAMAGVATALASSDPDRAERIINSITDKYWRDDALAQVAEELALSDPERAERFAQSITDHWMKLSILAQAAKSLAASDVARAKILAQSLTDLPKVDALAHIAEIEERSRRRGSVKLKLQSAVSPAAKPCGRENVAGLPADVAGTWCVVEAVLQPDAGSRRGAAHCRREHESPSPDLL